MVCGAVGMVMVTVSPSPTPAYPTASPTVQGGGDTEQRPCVGNMESLTIGWGKF